jgi:hypothetical protein
VKLGTSEMGEEILGIEEVNADLSFGCDGSCRLREGDLSQNEHRLNRATIWPWCRDCFERSRLRKCLINSVNADGSAPNLDLDGDLLAVLLGD